MAVRRVIGGRRTIRRPGAHARTARTVVPARRLAAGLSTTRECQLRNLHLGRRMFRNAATTPRLAFFLRPMFGQSSSQKG